MKIPTTMPCASGSCGSKPGGLARQAAMDPGDGMELLE